MFNSIRSWEYIILLPRIGMRGTLSKVSGLWIPDFESSTARERSAARSVARGDHYATRIVADQMPKARADFGGARCIALELGGGRQPFQRRGEPRRQEQRLGKMRRRRVAIPSRSP